MKKLLMSLGCCFLLLFCFVEGAVAGAERLPVGVSILPEKYFVEALGGERVSAIVVVPPAGSPATYEPKPHQMARLEKAPLYLAIGVPFERAWLPRLQGVNPEMKIIDISEGVKKRSMLAHVHEHGAYNVEQSQVDMENKILDPHIWLSPVRMQTVAENITHALIMTDPSGKAFYTKRLAVFRRQLTELDRQLRSIVASADGRTSFMVYHPSWGYLAEDYGLHQLPIELEGKEPGMKELASLVEQGRKLGVRAIFVQPQFSGRSAKLIAADIGARVVVANPLAFNWDENLMTVVRSIAKAAR
jgi:zinc transport system substrate-binding protein